MAKKAYSKPQTQWISVRPEQPVADKCWGHAKSGTPLYHDVPGNGYCQIILDKKGCGQTSIIAVSFPDAANMTSQEKEAAEAWFTEHLSQKLAEAGNNMAPFKGSGFVLSPDPDWS